MSGDLFAPELPGPGPSAESTRRGEGCCGPVVAAAVILDPARLIDRPADSKKLTEAARERLAPLIRERALAWTIAEASVERSTAQYPMPPCWPCSAP